MIVVVVGTVVMQASSPTVINIRYKTTTGPKIYNSMTECKRPPGKFGGLLH